MSDDWGYILITLCLLVVFGIVLYSDIASITKHRTNQSKNKTRRLAVVSSKPLEPEI